MIVETGVGVAGATSYCSEAHAGSYHDEHGAIDAWLEVIEAFAAAGMLREATRRIESRYAWLGTAKTTTQGLGLPRADLTLADGRVLDGQAQVLLAADATARLAMTLWRQRPQDDGRVVVAETLPDYAVRYQVTGPEGWDTIDAMLAPITGAPVPPGYYVAA